MLHTHFEQPLSSPWRISTAGHGEVVQQPGELRLTDHPTPEGRYSNAQISDYRTHRDFTHRPPLRLTVTAHVISPPLHAMERVPGGEVNIHGTAGFGFWNHPFAPNERGLRLPRAVWFFFASPPNDIRLARDLPGSGWKAMTMDATRPLFLTLLPAAPVGFLLMRIPALYRRLWPVGQRALGVSERVIDARLLAERHTYTLDWREEGVSFAVDGQTIHETDYSPRGSLGFIAWIDNQYAIVTPQGHFGYGAVPLLQAQSLILETIDIQSLL
jgi:hypothetical protein